MSPLDQSEVDYGRSKARVNYYKKATIQPGQSEIVNVVDVEKNTATKYPIPDENFCYRFILDDGRVWDETASSVFGAALKILYPDGKTFKPASLKISKLVSKPIKGSQYVVEKA